MIKSFKDFKTKKTRILAENVGELEVLTSNADNDSQRFAQRLSSLRSNIRHCAAAHAEQFYGLLSADDLRDADLLKTYGLTETYQRRSPTAPLATSSDSEQLQEKLK